MSVGPTAVTCPTCRQRLQIPLSAAGKKVRCPECDEDIPIPKSVPVAVPIPPPSAQAPAPAGPNPFDFDSDSPADEPPSTPYFTAIEPRTWTANRKYRVFVWEEQRELIAIYAGYAADAAMLGVIVEDDPGNRKAKKRAKQEANELDAARDAHPFNFSVWFKDIEEAEVVPTSFWFNLNHMSVPKIGLLKLTTTKGDWTLALATVEDMRRVLELFPPILGDRFESGVVWDKNRRRFRGA